MWGSASSAPSRWWLKARSYRARMRQQFRIALRTMLGIGAIDAFYGNREHAVFHLCYPAFCFQIPEMKLQMLARTACQAFKLVLADAGFFHVLPALDIKNRQQ